MRTLKKYVQKDDFDMPKSIDLTKHTAVLIRQSDKRSEEEHAYSRKVQLKLVSYAVRLRGDATDENIRVYDEGAGVSGQKHIHQRKVLNELYNDMKRGIIGSLVILHEDRLFRDKYHTNDMTFINLLAENNVMLFVKINHRRYDCTKRDDRNALLDKLIASRNYLDEQVLAKMNGGQEEKALSGQFDGRNLAMGYVVRGKRKHQEIVIYEPWAKTIRWMFARFKELGSITKLAHEIELMPFLFPDPTADACTMQRKQKLARLITKSVLIEEVSVHWLRFTVVWRGSRANTPDVCLIWRQRGRRSVDWTNEEDEYIRSNYPEGDKLTMLEVLPIRTWNMIYQRALTLGVYRKINTSNDIPPNVTVQDLNVIPDRETAIQLVTEASKRNNKSYAIWKRWQS